MNGIASDCARRRELAHRASHGLQVWLQWDPHDDEVFVLVHDVVIDATFELRVRDRAAALEAFHHPFMHGERRPL